MGGSAGSGNVEKMLEAKEVIIIMLITSIMLTTIGFYVTRWMYRISYGMCLMELKARIDELEKPD